VPRWCNRIGHYGIKVSFWGFASGTLKIVILVENHPPETDFYVFALFAPLSAPLQPLSPSRLSKNWGGGSRFLFQHR